MYKRFVIMLVAWCCIAYPERLTLGQIPGGQVDTQNTLPPSRRQSTRRSIDAMPRSRREAVFGPDYRTIPDMGTPQRRIFRPGYSDWRLGASTADAPLGLLIERVESWSPAYSAGLEPGDYILDVNGYPVGFYPGGYFSLQAAFRALADPQGWVELAIWNKRTKREEYMWIQLSRR